MADGSVVDVFDRLARECPEQTAVSGSVGVADVSSYSWSELREVSVVIASRIAAELAQLPANPNGSVAVLARRSPLWLATTVGVMRSGRPFVWMGAGELPVKSRHVEATRNAAIVSTLCPSLVVRGDVPAEVVPDWSSLPVSPRFLPLDEVVLGDATLSVDRPYSDILCYMMTGGTTGASKCVKVTHAMALHEIKAYPKIAVLGAEDRVLQHTAPLWAASTMGQLDIALAFGARICISDAVDEVSINSHGATVLGVVPSSLMALEPPPSLRCVFTWGESMSPQLGERWRRRVDVFELLISTEYWLSFMSSGAVSSEGRTVYRPVPGVTFAVLPSGEEQTSTAAGAVGELCLHGPMVSPGYVDGEERFAGAFLRTSDLVRLLDGSDTSQLEFRGRSDQFVKVAGQFVDLGVAEKQLQSVLGEGADAAVVPSMGLRSHGSAAHAFVSVTRPCSGGDAAGLLVKARTALPRGTSLHLVTGALPRNEVTGKVDRRRLLSGIQGEVKTLPAWPALKTRCSVYVRWLLFTTIVGAVDVPSLFHMVVRPSLPKRSRGSRALLRMILHIGILPYLWLLSMYLPTALLRLITNNLPFGRLGVVSALYHVGRHTSWTRHARASLTGSTLAGIVLAWRRGRLLPWWFAFWLAVPDHVQSECGWWLSVKGWFWAADRFSITLVDSPRLCLSALSAFGDAVDEVPALCSKFLKALFQRKSPTPEALLDFVERGAPSMPAKPEGQRPSMEVVWQECSAANATPHGASLVCDDSGASAPTPDNVAACDGTSTVPVTETSSGGTGAAPAFEPTVQQSGTWGWEFGNEELLPKDAWKEMDALWWEDNPRDVINATLPETTAVTKRDEAKRTGAPLKTATGVGARLLTLLAPHVAVDDPSTSLAGIDSLAVLTLCRNIRVEVPSISLRPHDVFQCADVGELLALVEARAEAAPPVRPASVCGEHAVWFAPGQYYSTCKWLYGCDGLLDERLFRVAAARLIARHVGLHADLCDGDVGIGLLRFFKDATNTNGILWPEVERVLQRVPPVGLASLAGAARRIVAWSLKGSWPRVAPVRITEDFLAERVKVVRCSSWSEAEGAISRHRDEFKPPFIMALFLVDSRSRGTCKSFVHFVVSHAFSDGFCSVPLAQDFGTLYANAEAPASAAALTPLPYDATFAVLQDRFFAVLEGRPAWSDPEQVSLRATCFDQPWASKWQPWVYSHEVLVESGAVSMLRQIARSYGLPFEVTLLSLVLAAMFRASAADSARKASYQGKVGDTDKLSIPLTMYAPMRDGDLNDAMVGLFSDWRDANVACSSDATLLGLCLDVADLIRQRRWTIFDPIQNSRSVLVNILPLDETVRSSRGLQQTRAHEYRDRRYSRPRGRKSQRCEHRPMRITLEQESMEVWWLALDINASHYSTSWCRRFVRELRQGLDELFRAPLTPVLPRAAGDSHADSGQLPVRDEG